MLQFDSGQENEMEWLTQNWIFVVGAVGVFLIMRRCGMRCGHGGGRHGNAGRHRDVTRGGHEAQ